MAGKSDDPRFPDRPQHHDFARLSAVVIEADDLSLSKTVPETMKGLCDLASAKYMAEGRASLIAARTGIGHGEPLHSMFAACFLDGLRAGIRFQQEGGHS